MVLLGSLFILPSVSSPEVASTPDGIVLTLEFPAPSVEQVTRDGETFLRVSIPGCGHEGTLGTPSLPVIRKLLQIPEEAHPTVRIEILAEEEAHIQYPVLPAQPPVAKSSEFPPRFVYDRQFYRTSGWIPSKVSAIERTGTIRKHRVAIVQVRPVRYCPSEGKLTIIRSLEVHISFNAGSRTGYSEGLDRYLSPPLKRLLGAAVANSWHSNGSKGDIGYLIIAGDHLADPLSPLVEWKRRKGFHTTLATLSSISPLSHATATAEEIKGYIKNAYDNWIIPPTYVLLVGDIGSIPSWTTQYPYLPAPTDLYYATMDENDILPDLWIGRLSVETPDAVNSAVEKIVDYETNTWKYGDTWLSRAYFIASDEGGIVWEGKTGHEIAESTHAYCMGIARQEGMVCDSLWGYYGTGTPVDAAFDGGRSLVVYSGHGSSSGWAGPPFYTWHAEALTNVDRYPFVLSHACLTGLYTSNCFGEVITRGDSSRALAFLGSTGPTYWIQDDFFQRAIFDALFREGMHTLSEIIGYAKFYLLSVIDTTVAYEYYEIYNLLGDPSLDLYTDSPRPMTVIHPDTIPAEPYVLEVQVQDAASSIEHALVSCVADTIWTAYTDSSGRASVEVDASSGDTVWLTVTGRNLRPYQSYILTTSVGIVEPPEKSVDCFAAQNYPNPFHDATDIRYYISEEGILTLEIYDSTGRMVIRRIQEATPGWQTFTWDGRSSSGKPVSSGIYFYRLNMAGKSTTRKMALMR
jgi:hypothetical protein